MREKLSPFFGKYELDYTEERSDPFNGKIESCKSDLIIRASDPKWTDALYLGDYYFETFASNERLQKAECPFAYEYCLYDYELYFGSYRVGINIKDEQQGFTAYRKPILLTSVLYPLSEPPKPLISKKMDLVFSSDFQTLELTLDTKVVNPSEHLFPKKINYVCTYKRIE